MINEDNFAKRVCDLVSNIPKGRVMTYGQVAGLCGNARAARIVGGIAHHGDPDLPWHRVVNKKGKLASGYHGGSSMQKKHLEEDGIRVIRLGDEYYVDINSLLWGPGRE